MAENPDERHGLTTISFTGIVEGLLNWNNEDKTESNEEGGQNSSVSETLLSNASGAERSGRPLDCVGSGHVRLSLSDDEAREFLDRVFFIGHRLAPQPSRQRPLVICMKKLIITLLYLVTVLSITILIVFIIILGSEVMMKF